MSKIVKIRSKSTKKDLRIKKSQKAKQYEETKQALQQNSDMVEGVLIELPKLKCKEKKE